MIKIKTKGDFKFTTSMLDRIKMGLGIVDFDSYGRRGVEELKKYTPVDTGETAASWYYKINIGKEKTTISFHNDNIVDNVPIAVILQYGHATKNGSWVEGIDYINPAIKPLFEKLADDAWREVVNK